MTWKTKTCEDCTFRVDRYCRRFPPIAQSQKMWNTYPQIHSRATGYMWACAEHATELQQLTIKEVVR